MSRETLVTKGMGYSIHTSVEVEGGGPVGGRGQHRDVAPGPKLLPASSQSMTTFNGWLWCRVHNCEHAEIQVHIFSG